MKYILILLSLVVSGCFAFKSGNTHRINIERDSVLTEYNLNFIEGTKFKLLGNKNKAILSFARCIELNPSSSATYFQLSEIYYSMEDYKRALYFSQKCNAFEKSNQWYILQLAKLYQHFENIDSTIFLYKRLVQLAPVKAEYTLNLAFLYFKSNKPSHAIKVLTNYKKRFGLNEEVALTLYQIYKFLDDNKNCILILRESIHRFPDETRYYGLLAEQFMSSNQMDSAYLYYQKLLNIDPENDKGLLSLIEYYKANSDSANVYKSAALFVKNSSFKIDDKIEILTFFISDKFYLKKYATGLDTVISSLIELYPGTIKLYLLQADLYIRSNSLVKAKYLLIDITKKFKANYPVWEQLLFTCNTLRNYTELLNYSVITSSKFPEMPLPYLFQGMSCFYLKNYADGIEPLLKGLELVSQSKELTIQFCTFLGESYQSLNQFERSEYYFERVLQFDPKNVMVLNNYSYYLALRSSNLNKALEYMNVCIALQPNSSTFLDTYAWVLFKMGNVTEARQSIEKAIHISGVSNLEIVEHYCEILLKDGDAANALKYYQVLENSGKSNIYLKSLLKLDK